MRKEKVRSSFKNRILLKIFFFGFLIIVLFILKNLFSSFEKPVLVKKEFGQEPKEKIYQNEKFNFKFSYPANWQFEEWDFEKATNLKKAIDGTVLYQGKFFSPPKNDFSGNKGHFEILIWENKRKASLRTWLSWFRHEDLNLAALPQKENFVFASYPAIYYLQKKTAKGIPIVFIFFAKEDKIFELIQWRDDLLNFLATESSQFAHPVYDRILQSFQFLL